MSDDDEARLRQIRYGLIRLLTTSSEQEINDSLPGISDTELVDLAESVLRNLRAKVG